MAAKAKTSQKDSRSNTGGRPKGPWKDKAWRDALRVIAMSPADDDRKGRNKIEAAAVALFREALNGDVPALKEIGDRLDGKVPQALVGGDDDSKPIRVTRVELVDLA